MKKQLISLFIVVFALFFTSQSFGQFKAGIKAGYNNSTLGGLSDMADVKEVKALAGFHAGVFGQLKITFITLQVDALYSTQGTKWTDTNNAAHKYENNYLNIPAVAQVNLGPIFILGGIQYGMLLKSTIDDVADDNGLLFKKTDFAIPVGLGFNVSKLVLEARYNIGITNINNLSEDEVLTNGVLQLSAGYKFGK